MNTTALLGVGSFRFKNYVRRTLGALLLTITILSIPVGVSADAQMPAPQDMLSQQNQLVAADTSSNLVAQTADNEYSTKPLPDLLTKTDELKKIDVAPPPTDSTPSAIIGTAESLKLVSQIPDLSASPLPAVKAVPVATPHAPTSATAAPRGPHLRYVDGRLYPYAHAAWPNESVDPWGMYKRQCVSYAAWKVAASGRHMPYWGGSGDARKWIANARQAGIAVDTTPRVGDVAISSAGASGHAMYVEAVNSNGTIYISQYNAHYDGAYSTATRSASGLLYIHFS